MDSSISHDPFAPDDGKPARAQAAEPDSTDTQAHAEPQADQPQADQPPTPPAPTAAKPTSTRAKRTKRTTRKES